MLLPKGEDHSDIYKKWKVTTGVRIYDDEAATQFVQVPQRKMIFKAGQPDYSEEKLDEDIASLFEFGDDEEEYGIEIETDTKLLASKKAETSLTIDGKTLSASQQLFPVFELNYEPDRPNEVSFLFEVDLPREALKKGAIIYQFAQLTDKNGNAGDNKIGIACKVQIGNPAGTEVAAFEGTDSMKIADNSGKTYKQVTGGSKAGLNIRKIDDDFFYGLSDSENWKNKIQNCLASLEVPKEDT